MRESAERNHFVDGERPDLTPGHRFAVHDRAAPARSLLREGDDTGFARHGAFDHAGTVREGREVLLEQHAIVRRRLHAHDACVWQRSSQ